MAFKFVALLACVAYANAGLLAAPAVGYSAYAAPQVPAITTQSQNILRSPGNLAQVSTYSKTIDTPFSSVSKSDVRVSNPGYVSAAYAPVAHAVAPVATYAAAPVVAKTYAAPLVAKTYAAPAVHAAYAAPAVHSAYAAPAVHAAYAAPVAHAAYAAPVAHAVAAPAHGLLGVAYSAAPAVAHVEYHGLGLNYAF